MSNAQRMSKEEVKIAKAKPKKKGKAKEDTDEQLIALAAQAEALGASGNSVGPRTNPNASRGVSWVVPGILLVAMLMLGGALYKVAFTNETPPPEMPFYDKPVPIPHGPDDNPMGTAQQPQKDPGKDAPSKDDPKKDKPPPVHSGTVTIITFPEATVFRGKQQIGQTPLFNAALPVGTQLLTLVGADGVKHVLSVPVRDGKNSPIKVKLDELPSR
jgi:hypothetical protein